MSAHLPNLKSLSVSERIQLVEDIWDSIEEDTREEPGLTPAQMTEVDRRVEAHLADPSSGIPWTEVREKLFARPA